ncbi:MAG: protoporphyrinogen oxidase [Deltaproteobacteria bacterium]|nr:protoporphyrinogen oxidase [Deltaproteobacteria bacterium]
MRVCVIGGGLGGLTAARALFEAGLDAHVLEASPHTGGVVGTSTVDGFVREHAASSFLGGQSRGAVSLCQKLGVPLETASSAAKQRWIYIDGKLRALPRSPVELVRSDLLTWRGKLDLLREPFRAARIEGDESMHAFAARRFGAEAARAIVAPFVTGVFAADAHDISLEAGFPRLAELDATGGLARGLVKQAAKRVFRKLAGGRRKPATAGMFAPHGGLGTMIEALARGLGDRVHTDHPVRALVPTERGVNVDGEPWDAAVLALPAQDAIALVDAVPTLASRLAAFRRAPAAIVYLGFPEAAVPRAVDGFGFLVAQGEDLRVLGVVFESVVWPNRAPAGQVLLRCIFGGSRDPAAATLDDATLIEQATRDVGLVLGARGTPTHASVIHWHRGIAQYQVGHRDHVRAAVTAARTHRIALAGADYRGAGINDLCADADIVVEEIRSWV